MTTAIADRAAVVSPDRTQGAMLALVPILGPSHDQPEYALLNPGTAGNITVEEVSAAGSVPTLRVRNGLSSRVYLTDGQELRGAKQNRILNTDVLVPAGATIDIPVSCVEQGRWRSTSKAFAPGKSAGYRTRSSKAQRVHNNLKMVGKHDAGQTEVWEEVAASLQMASAHSPTSALSDAYAKRQRELDDFRSRLVLPDRAVGAAIFRDGEFAGLDLFDRHSTLQQFWQNLLDSYAIDLLEPAVDLSARPAEQAPATESGQQVRQMLSRAAEAKWESFTSPGEGADWRLDDGKLCGSALVWEDRVVIHLQLFPACAQPPHRLSRRRC